VLHLRLIILSVKDDVPVDSETLLMTDFMNLKIKPARFFRGTNTDRMCVHVFIGVGAHTHISIYICTVFLKKSSSHALREGKVPHDNEAPFQPEVWSAFT
jgi:hypothetical protein